MVTLFGISDGKSGTNRLGIGAIWGTLPREPEV
jgi:hypothetical protein